MPNKSIIGKLEKKADVYSIIASTGKVDRDNEIILPSAFKNLKEYLKKNPVILFAHDYWKPPIAKATKGKITDDALELGIEFAETELGKETQYLYNNGFMNSFSVGFIPKVWDVNSEGQRVYTDVELLEVSAVPVPSNSAATMIRQAKSAGIDMQEFEKLYADRPESKLESKGVKAERKSSDAESYINIANKFNKLGGKQ